MKMRKAHRSTCNGVGIGLQFSYSIPNYNSFYFDIYIYKFCYVYKYYTMSRYIRKTMFLKI